MTTAEDMDLFSPQAWSGYDPLNEERLELGEVFFRSFDCEIVAISEFRIVVR